MDLSAIRALLPNFTQKDFIMFDAVLSLTWSCITDDCGEARRHITLEMTSDRGFKMVMECSHVRSFHFDGDGQIAGFAIEDLSENGYESEVRYRVRDFEEDSILFYCSDIVIKHFLPLVYPLDRCPQ